MKYKGRDKNSLRIKDREVSVSLKQLELITFSFKDVDHTQGQTFSEWQELGLLDIMLDRFKEYSKKTIPAAQGSVFHIYGEFPPQSGFKHPAYIGESVKWAAMHIKGKERVVGYMDRNIFNVVFLDKDHEFWPSKLKHT
jgi:hypothetical protein